MSCELRKKVPQPHRSALWGGKGLPYGYQQHHHLHHHHDQGLQGHQRPDDAHLRKHPRGYARGRPEQVVRGIPPR